MENEKLSSDTVIVITPLKRGHNENTSGTVEQNWSWSNSNSYWRKKRTKKMQKTESMRLCVKWGSWALTIPTVCDLCTFAILFSVSKPFACKSLTLS